MLLQLSQFFPFAPPPTSTPIPSGNPHTIVLVHGSFRKVLGYSIPCTLHPHGYSVTTYLCFLIPSPLHPFPHTPLPSGSHQNALCIHDPVSVLLPALLSTSVGHGHVHTCSMTYMFIQPPLPPTIASLPPCSPLAAVSLFHVSRSPVLFCSVVYFVH